MANLHRMNYSEQLLLLRSPSRYDNTQSMKLLYYPLTHLQLLQKIFTSKAIVHNTLLHSFPDIGLDPIKLYSSWSSLYSLKFILTINFSQSNQNVVRYLLKKRRIKVHYNHFIDSKEYKKYDITVLYYFSFNCRRFSTQTVHYYILFQIFDWIQ